MKASSHVTVKVWKPTEQYIFFLIMFLPLLRTNHLQKLTKSQIHTFNEFPLNLIPGQLRRIPVIAINETMYYGIN